MEQNPGKDSWMMRLYRAKIMSFLLYSHAYFLRRELKNCRRVLDIGSGISSPLRHCRLDYSLAVERFAPALKDAKARNTHQAYILADAAHIEFKPRSFDAVVLCELLEHIDKDSSLNLLKKAEGWAIKKVLISSPNGYLPYPYEAMHGNPYQAHRSGWEISEMRERGYRAYGLVGLRFRPFPSSVPMSILWAFLSVLLQCITYYFPEIAFWVFYVKDKESARTR